MLLPITDFQYKEPPREVASGKVSEFYTVLDDIIEVYGYKLTKDLSFNIEDMYIIRKTELGVHVSCLNSETLLPIVIKGLEDKVN